MYITTAEDYWIDPSALSITRNALGEPDRIQASVASGAVIMCYVKDIEALGYDTGHNYRRWPLSIAPTYFNSHTEKYIYIAIPSSSEIGTNAIVVFPSQIIDIEGYAVTQDSGGNPIRGEHIGQDGYYYVWLQGKLTSSGDSGLTNREWQPKYQTGSLRTDQSIEAFKNYSWWGQVPGANGLIQGPLAGMIDYIEFSNGVRLGVDIISNTLHFYMPDATQTIVDETTGEERVVTVPGNPANVYATGGVSALGYGPGGGGGGVTLNNVLDGINNTTFPSATPSSAGQAIVWDGTKWTFGTAGGGGTDLNAVWSSLEAEDGTKQIDLSHLTNALAGYATQSWVTSQGYLTSLPSHNHDDRYKFGTTGIGTVQITLGGTTKSVLTNHQSLADYVKTIQLGTNGTVYSPTSGKVTLPAYPTTLPASDVYSWAKAANKPSYSFSEITNHPTTLAGYGITDAKFGTAATTYVPITLGGTTKNVLLSSSLSDYLPLSGGTMTGQIYSTTGAGSWIEGRDKALIRKDITNTTSWWPILSVKTADGSWEMGAISDNDDVKNALILSYATDDNYNANNNNVMRILFPKSAGTLALLSDNVASSTKLQIARSLWGNNFDGTQSIGNPDSWAPLNWVTNIVMKGNLDWRYNGAGSMTSRILEYESGGLSVNTCAYHFNSNKPANSSTFPGGALNVTTDWGDYSFRNVFTGNSLFENTLFLRQDLYMKTNTGIRIKNYAGANVTALSLESNSSNNSIVVGAGAHTVAGVSTVIRGNTVNFQTANGAGTTIVGHFANSGDFYIDVAGKSLIMNDGTTTRSMMGINIPDTHFHLCYGAVGANWQTRIYGGGGDDKGIAFYQGTTLAAGISGGDHSLVAFYHIKLTNNNTSLFTRNTAANAVDTIKMDSNNILNFGLGCNIYNHETRLYGGATAGIGFFCGSTEVARIHKDSARQGIRIGDGLLSWDSNNNAFKVSKIDGQGNEVAANLYALGGVSALGFTAPQSSLDAFHIDYLTSTNIQTTTMGISGRLSLGSANCYMEAGSTGNLTINASSGLTLGNSKIFSDPTGGLHADRFYLDDTRYLFIDKEDNNKLKFYDGSQNKTVYVY